MSSDDVDDDEDEVGVSSRWIGDARRVASARAAGPLPSTRTSHSSLNVGVINAPDSSDVAGVVAAVTTSDEVVL